MFQQLLHLDTLRGFDSTGVLHVDDTYKHGIEKALSIPFFLFNSKGYKERVSHTQKRDKHLLLMGHNRAATQGKITVQNAHPFKQGHIVLAHNGTLHGVWGLKQGTESFDTDSEHICYAINHVGVEEAWPRISGAAALTFWNLKTRRLHLVRNTQRPLCYAMTEDDEQVIWASEAWMIEAVCNRNNVKLSDKVWEINPHWLFTFKWHKKQGQVMMENEKLNEYKAPAFRIGYRTNTPPWYQEEDGWDGVDAEQNVIPFRGKRCRTTDDPLTHAKNIRLHKPTREDFKDAAPFCEFCGTQAEYDDSIYLDPKHVICGGCYTNAYDWHRPYSSIKQQRQ